MRPPRLLHAFTLWWLLAASAGVAAQGVFAGTGPWLDDRGQAFRVESLLQRRSIVSLAYGACRRVCSTSLRLLEHLQARADARGEALNFVIIGLDPSQDRPADWAAYRAERNLVRANWHFLTGDPKSIGLIAHRLGVNYWHYGEHVVHDFRIVLLTPQGLRIASLDTPDQNLATLLP